MEQERAIRNVLIWDSARTDAEASDIVLGGGGRIKDVLPPNSASGETVFDGKGKTVALPGLANTHTHVSMTLLRGLGEELPLMDWLQQKIFPVEAKLEPRHVRSGADLGILEMIAGGVTAFADMYYFMDEVAESVLASGIRAALSRGLPGDDVVKLEENVQLARDYGDREGRIKVQLGPHAPYTVPREALAHIAEVARENNLGIHFHWLETKGELDSFEQEYKVAPVDYLEQAGLLEAKELILAHSVWFPTEELDRVRKDNITLVHNPKSNLKLGSGYAPVKEMLAAGVNVALGTDGAASNNRLDVWDEMRTAALMHKGYHLDPTLLSAREVLRMATVGGMRAMGFVDGGFLRPGGLADIVLVDTDRPQYVGMNASNVPEFMVYAGSSRDVVGTIVAGQFLYRDGSFATMDRAEILAQAAAHRREIE